MARHSGRGKNVNGRFPKQEGTPTYILEQRNKLRGEKDRVKFDIDNAHYHSVLLEIVRETIEAGMPHKTDEVKLAEIFNTGNKKWLDVVAKVNRVNKVIKLSNQSFRYQIFQAAYGANHEKIKTIKPEVIKTDEEEVK